MTVRVCVRCKARDPMWSGLPSDGWETIRGKLLCAACLWMLAGTDDDG